MCRVVGGHSVFLSMLVERLCQNVLFVFREYTTGVLGGFLAIPLAGLHIDPSPNFYLGAVPPLLLV
jgi:hypothetical protein